MITIGKNPIPVAIASLKIALESMDGRLDEIEDSIYESFHIREVLF